MKILQLNIWGGKLGKQIIELLDREQPDIVCFQEAFHFPERHAVWFSPVEDIAEAVGYSHVHSSPLYSFNYFNRKVMWANTILSKIPFESAATVFTRGEFTDDFDFLDGDKNMRNLSHVTVRHNGELLHVLNHHGHHVSEHKNGDEETVRRCKLTADYVSGLEGEVVLCGDFNLAPDSESLGLLNAILRNHCIESGVTTTRTALTQKTEVCDYIFTSRDLATKNFTILPDIASDHAALMIELA